MDLQRVGRLGSCGIDAKRHNPCAIPGMDSVIARLQICDLSLSSGTEDPLH